MTVTLDWKFELNKKSMRKLVKEEGIPAAIDYMGQIPEDDLDSLNEYRTLLDVQINKQAKNKGAKRDYLSQAFQRYRDIKALMLDNDHRTI